MSGHYSLLQPESEVRDKTSPSQQTGSDDGRRVFRKKGGPPWKDIVFILYSITVTSLLILSTLGRWPESLESRPFFASRITYEQQKEIPRPYSIYSETPSLKHDWAWAELLHPINIYATPEELTESGIDLAGMVKHDEGQYMASIGVYHELHCLRRIRWNFYPDYYFPNATHDDRERELEHMNHCSELLRRSIVCSGNSALYTFELRDGAATSRSSSRRQCVNWNHLHEWASERALGPKPTYEGSRADVRGESGSGET